ncbi:MAG: hypothetical protein ACE5JN_00890 [Candidatus Methylomirabilia bacterium]
MLTGIDQIAIVSGALVADYRGFGLTVVPGSRRPGDETRQPARDFLTGLGPAE